MTKHGTKWLVAALAVAMVFGIAATGAMAAVNSGAADFTVNAFPTATSVGGDPINLTINVLDKNGNINTFSSGQYGDVLFQITTSLGTTTVPASSSGGASSAGGYYEAMNLTNIRPNAGVLLAAIEYGGSSGTDTVTVSMFETVINASGDVVAGNIIGTKSVTVTVNQGTTISKITGITFTNAVDGTDATTDSQRDTVSGRATGIKVTTDSGSSGKVTVSFVGIDKKDSFGNNAKGTTVTADVQVSNGVGTGTVTLTKAGYYEVRGATDTVAYTRLVDPTAATDISGSAFQLYVRPGAAKKLALSFEKTVVAVSASAQNTNAATVVRMDSNDNASGYSDPTTNPATNAGLITISLTPTPSTYVSTGTVTIGASSASGTGNITGLAAGTATVVASAGSTSGLTDSSAVSVIAKADGLTGASVSVTTAAVGSSLTVSTINETSSPATLKAGQPVSLKFGKQTLSSTLTGSAAPYTATFTLPTTAMSGTLVLEMANGALGSFTIGTLTTYGAAGKTVQLINPNGFAITGFNANYRGLAFNFPNTSQGSKFQVLDQYGNDVSFSDSALTGTLSSTDLASGNNSTVNLGKGATSDALLTWASTVKGTKTVTLTPVATSGIPAITFNVDKLGTPTLASIKVTPGATSTLANSSIPLIIETFDTNGKRTALSGTNNLIVTVQSTKQVASLSYTAGGTRTVLASGSIIDTYSTNAGSWAAGTDTAKKDGRLALTLNTGNVQDTVRVTVSTLDGTLSANSGDITVSVNSTKEIGNDPGTTTTTVVSDQAVILKINTTNKYGDTPAHQWFVFTGTASGIQLPLYLLGDKGIVAIVPGLDIYQYTYSYPAGSTVQIAQLKMTDLGLKAGDTFAYAYAYDTAAGKFVMDNVVIITVK
ncbi:beta strand repeat-containing protein [Desulfatirhabdium butyrativorans]|uniref:beta strand repeat-containing protein n=1 Tax=Desulfatirhabdium butyrativorans TaxID=340467 RepID=UPI00040DDF00|nr:hypothetical protein [Desulfatirhabdium butyrativorans]